MAHFNRNLFLCLLLSLLSYVSQAQPGVGPGGPPGGGGGNPGGGPPVPITGIEILIGLGGALGVKRLLGVKEKSKKP